MACLVLLACLALPNHVAANGAHGSPVPLDSVLTAACHTRQCLPLPATSNTPPNTLHTTRCTRHARRWAWSARSPRCSRPPSTKTSPWAGPRARRSQRQRCTTPRGAQTRTSSSPQCPSVTRRRCVCVCGGGGGEGRVCFCVCVCVCACVCVCVCVCARMLACGMCGKGCGQLAAGTNSAQ
jgi:hypothetical protein